MENFLLLAETEVNAAIVIFNLLFAFVLGFAITWVYRKTHHGLSYSQQFLTTLVLLSVLGSVVMMVVSQNLIGAFALLGAFSLIRFRTILKETRDIAFVFFALVVGVAVGVNSYIVATLSTIMISIIILLLKRFNFGSIISGSHLLIVLAGTQFTPEEESSWKKYVRHIEILHVKTVPPNRTEYTIDVTLENEDALSNLSHELQHTRGVEHVELMNGRGSVEY